MSARENILAKLKKADALPMEEPAVFDYYREMGVSWDSEVERLKHWAAAMRAVKTEILLGDQNQLAASIPSSCRKQRFEKHPAAVGDRTRTNRPCRAGGQQYRTDCFRARNRYLENRVLHKHRCRL